MVPWLGLGALTAVAWAQKISKYTMGRFRMTDVVSHLVNKAQHIVLSKHYHVHFSY